MTEIEGAVFKVSEGDDTILYVDAQSFYVSFGNIFISADYSSQIIPVKIIVVKRDTEFDYYNFLLVLFDWYNPHLYQRTTGSLKYFSIPVFLHHITEWKRV